MENTSQFLAGNEVLAESAIRAGCQFYAGYPITPQNDLGAYMAAEMPKHDRVFIQAESELAAINMVFGAAAAGARAMTTSSSPGISLKQEGISYLCGAELPGVIVNVMRGGPGLGNISGSQGDYFQATRGGGHGDYRVIVLAPHSVQEIADLTFPAFELAERYRMPAMILYDGYLGQLVENVTLPPWQEPPGLDRPYALGGNAGRPSRVIRSLYMGDGALEEHNRRLQARYAELARKEARFEKTRCDDADLLLVAFGMAARQCAEALDLLRANGLRAGLFRPVTLWPYPAAALREAARGAKAVLAVEMNHGQMVEDIRLALAGSVPVHFLGRAGGGVPAVSVIREKASEILTPQPALK